MSLPGGIRVRIALALAAIVAFALGAAYMIVVPSLEQRLVDARLDELRQRAIPAAGLLPKSQYTWQGAVERMAERTNARVVAFNILSGPPSALVVGADSRGRGSSRDVQKNPIALHALASGHVERGRVSRSHADFGAIAVPVGSEAIVLFQTNLSDSLATVHLVERRLLLATGFALVLALALGLFGSRTLAQRLRRLETAAERIAGGDFEVPVLDRGHDEIGQLAGAFDRMRVQLSQLDTARKEFVANASHELRTPLFSLGGFLELLTDEDLDEETRDGFLVAMQGQIERLTKLSADLLDLSRVDAGQLSVAREPVDIGDLVRALLAELEPVTVAYEHTVDADVESEVWCLGDEARVLQVGRALVTNALVHTPRGTPVIVRVRRRGDRAELAVVDEGPGIPNDQQRAVFERFYRIEGGVASGSGLGLSIAKELARLMDGSIRLESRPGRTAVTLDLPGEPAPATAAAFSRENAAGLAARSPKVPD